MYCCISGTYTEGTLTKIEVFISWNNEKEHYQYGKGGNTMKRTKTKLLTTLFVIALIMYGITFNEEVNARTITEDETNQIFTEITQKIENKSKSVIENDVKFYNEELNYYRKKLNKIIRWNT